MRRGGFFNVGHLNGTDIQEGGDKANSLSAGNAKQPDTIIAFTSKDHGADAGEVSPTLRALNHKDSHMNGGGQVAIAFHPSQDPISSTDGSTDGSTHALGCGSKQGQASVAIAFDTTQITSKENRCNPQAGDPCHPLASGAHPPAVTLEGIQDAYKCGDCSHYGHQSVHQTTCPVCGAVDSYWNVMIEPRIGPDAGKVFDFDIQAFKPSHFTRGKDGAPSELHPPLSADADKGDQEPVIFQTRIARNGRGQPDTVCPSLNGTNAGDTSDMRPVVATTMAVRRLTPLECERLMGWEDGWTNGFSDSVRYKMCGNGVVGTCSVWIGKRIVRYLQ